MDVKISFHGPPFSGKYSTIELLQKQKFIEILSEKQFILPTRIECFSPFSWLDKKSFPDCGKIITFKFRRKMGYLKTHLVDTIFHLSLISGTVWNANTIFEFLVKDTQGMMFFFDLSTMGENMAGTCEWEYLLNNFHIYNKNDIADFPIVICYNKKDLQQSIIDLFVPPKKTFSSNLRQLDQILNPHNFPYFATSTQKKKTIFEAFQTFILTVLKKTSKI